MTQARDLADGKFDTNTLVVDAANNRVGVGTTSPQRDLEINGTAANSKAFTRYTHGGLASTGLDVGYSSGGYASIYNAENTATVFSTNATERLRILSGGGLTFNGDTAAANALDDYEEGTWTPSVGAGLTSVTYDNQSGSYVKIGGLVIASFDINTSGGTANGDQVRFDGLPYAKKNSDPSEGGYITYQFNFDSVHTYPYVGNKQNYVYFHEINGTGLNGTELSSTEFVCRGTVIYRAS